MCKINVGYLGYGTRALDALMNHPNFEVKFFIAPESRLCDDVYLAHERYSELPYHVVKNNQDLAEVLSGYQNKVTCVVMNACPIILKENVLNILPVYNIHPGDLRCNRGHQPHMWSILLGEKESCIAMHSVIPAIDEGIVIRSRKLEISEQDTDLSLLNRLEDEIPYLLDGLYDFLKHDAKPEDEIYGGTYRRVMTYDDYCIDFQDVGKEGFLDEMSRKIRSRYSKHGAFFYFQDSRIYVKQLVFVETLEEKISELTVSFVDDKVIVTTDCYRFTFQLCQIVQ